ncbi:MAG: FAD:protein FMN transferase [bacterium]|nr:FAD:protein FMN transferase [bacterium]
MHTILATHAMGTRFELVLVANSSMPEAQLRAIGEEALFEIEEADRRLSLFRKDSLLSHINRSGSARGVRVDPDTYAMLKVCDEVWRASDGAFDPTVAPLMAARGFHGGERGDAQEALARVGWRHVRFDDAHRAVHLEQPGVALDLGAVGKGHGLDLAARTLRENGVTSALLHGGTSTVVAIGTPPDEDAWRVSLGEGAPLARLEDACLSVSAPHGRTVREDGESRGHVLDPRTGRSVNAVTLAAVIAPNATLADAASTALLVRGAALAAPTEVETLHRTSAGAWRHSAHDSACFDFEAATPKTQETA